jgi:4-hydroxy-4-methyl-2-oxoglutarate aldolase
MKSRLYLLAVPVVALAGLALFAQQRPAATPQAAPAGQPLTTAALVEGFRQIEVASVADAIEQLYGKKLYMYHDMRPVFKTKFAGTAWTVKMKKEENTEGAAAVQGMLDAIDAAPPGQIYVMELENGLDYAGMGALMASGMKARGFTGAVIDGGLRDTPQLARIQFPVFSRGIVPSTAVNHYRFVGVNVPVTVGGVQVNPGDIISADEDGVVVIPKAQAEEILKKSQQLDLNEHRTMTFIEELKSIKEAVAKFGRI